MLTFSFESMFANFVGEFKPGLPSAAGEREGVARLEIRGKARFVAVEVEKGPARLPLGDQVRPEQHIGNAGHALERLVEIGPVEAAACADIEGDPCGRKCAQRFRILSYDALDRTSAQSVAMAPISLMMPPPTGCHSRPALRLTSRHFTEEKRIRRGPTATDRAAIHAYPRASALPMGSRLFTLPVMVASALS
jgi:hypothetical protein